jgi:ABC-type amino acid transport substrate-binding protein
LARARKVRFSQPYLSLKHALVLNRTLVAKMAKDQPIENLVRDFRGSIGVLANSSYANFARRNFPHAQVLGYDAWQDAVDDVIAGHVAALYRDDFETKRVLQADNRLSLTLSTVTLTDLDDDVGIAVGADDHSLLAFINMFLEKRPRTLSVEDVLRANDAYENAMEAAQ